MITTEFTWGYAWIIDLTLIPVGVLLLLLILRKAGRVERALWAVVSQLQAMRREFPAAVNPAASVGLQPAVPGEHHVSLSMFGR